METTVQGWPTSTSLHNYTAGGAEGPVTIIHRIRQYGVIILVVFGLIFNTLSFIVFWSSRLRKTSQGQYLLALSVSDNLVLVTEFLIWLKKSAEVHWIDDDDTLCRLTYTFRYAGRLWSAILVMTITIERYCFIVIPFKTRSFRKDLPAKITCTVTCILSHLMSLYAAFTLRIQPFSSSNGQQSVCSIPKDKEVPFTVCDLVFSRGIADVLTGMLIFVFTSLIVKHLLRARQHRITQLQVHNLQQASQRQFHLTVMLLALAVSFIFLKLPYTLAYYSKWLLKMYTGNRATYQAPAAMDAAINVTYVFAVMTYSVNFVFYAVCGSSFRQSLCKLLHCQPDAQRPTILYTYVNGKTSSGHHDTSI